MARKKKANDYGTGIPYHEVEALALVHQSTFSIEMINPNTLPTWIM